MKFQVQRFNHEDDPYSEYSVTAVSPANGNDASLVAVFNSKGAADELAGLLNYVAGLKAVHEDEAHFAAQYPTFAPQGQN